ncbi:peroxiredoxin [Mycoplasma iguanae]|uniref:Peroxiredoxin n=1 Tax=Mycoplasma iguanae TaxID=292461 RepID=A0ABY5RAP2_9MOLU|nr:peroxiredoxin [Mycoplasma iguanae]UVD81817.1 peroxiredoxin [Mycoplasma iguanae]
MSTITVRGTKFNLVGTPVKVGDQINAKVANLEFQDQEINQLFTKDLNVISIFPSINTSVCDEQTRGISQLAHNNPEINFIALSLDLPTALKEWCGTHGVDNISIFSDYKQREFSTKYGLLVEGIFLMNRAIIVVDKTGKVLYVKHNTELSDQIDFTSLEDFLK